MKIMRFPGEQQYYIKNYSKGIMDTLTVKYKNSGYKYLIGMYSS
jgi:hypothetical protein